MTITVTVLKAKSTNVNAYLPHIPHADIGAQSGSHFALTDAGHALKFDVYGSGFSYGFGIPLGGNVKHFLVRDHGAAIVDVSFGPAVAVATLTSPSSFHKYFDHAPFVFKGNNGNDTFQSGWGADRVEGRGGNDRFQTGIGNDRLDGGKGNDYLEAREGKDVLLGGLGTDKLFGGPGPDTFDFNSIAESRPGPGRDVILSFFRGQGDHVDVRTIDADTTKASNQAFHFVGDTTFSRDPGELRFNKGYLQGDVNGDGRADFEVKVGVTSMVKSDFLL